MDTGPPRLLTTMSSLPTIDLGDLGLPIIGLADMDFHAQIFRGFLPVYRAAGPTADLLATPMRNAEISGPSLRRAHQDVGRWLAITFLAELLDLEDFDMKHVQGHTINGRRIKNESTTVIVALMRGGEPMAMGVSEVMPTASFVHAKKAEEIGPKLLKNADTIILVDSVINRGASMVEFLSHLVPSSAATATTRTSLVKDDVKIAMMTGVVQDEAVQRLRAFAAERPDVAEFILLALRSSKNKYTGKGGTDTGNRLFNTTQVD